MARAIVRAMAAVRAMAERMVQLGVVMQENGTAHYRKFIADDMARYAAIVQKLGLQIK